MNDNRNYDDLSTTGQLKHLDALHMCGAVEEAVDGKGVEVVRCSTGDCLEVKGRCQMMGRLVLKVLESLSEN